MVQESLLAVLSAVRPTMAYRFPKNATHSSSTFSYTVNDKVMVKMLHIRG
jgi:hypothetical protein